MLISEKIRKTRNKLSSAWAKSFFWNAIYGGFSALESALILLVAARTLDLSSAGIITFGFAVGNLAMVTANYGIGTYQATDSHEVYSFTEYYLHRVLTVAGTLLIALVFLLTSYCAEKYSGYKAEVIGEIIILKLIDSFESLYTGRLQQKGRLDIGAKFASIRLIASIAVICAVLALSKNAVLSFLAGIIVSIVLDAVLLPKEQKYADIRIGKTDPERVEELFRAGFPLCVGAALTNYMSINKTPQYVIRDIYGVHSEKCPKDERKNYTS